MVIITDPVVDPSNADLLALESALAALYVLAPTMATWNETVTLDDEGPTFNCIARNSDGNAIGFSPRTAAGRAFGAVSSAAATMYWNESVTAVSATFP